jgi:hypothetical protein
VDTHKKKEKQTWGKIKKWEKKTKIKDVNYVWWYGKKCLEKHKLSKSEYSKFISLEQKNK